MALRICLWIWMTAFISHTQTIRLLRDWEHQHLIYANNTFYNQGLQEEAALSTSLQVVIFQHLRYCLGPGFSIKRCENFDENSCRLGFRNGRLGYLGKLSCWFFGSVLEDLHAQTSCYQRCLTGKEHLPLDQLHTYIYMFAHSDHNTHLPKKIIERNHRSIASAELFVFGLV